MRPPDWELHLLLLLLHSLVVLTNGSLTVTWNIIIRNDADNKSLIEGGADGHKFIVYKANNPTVDDPNNNVIVEPIAETEHTINHKKDKHSNTSGSQAITQLHVNSDIPAELSANSTTTIYAVLSKQKGGAILFGSHPLKARLDPTHPVFVQKFELKSVVGGNHSTHQYESHTFDIHAPHVSLHVKLHKGTHAGMTTTVPYAVYYLDGKQLHLHDKGHLEFKSEKLQFAEQVKSFAHDPYTPLYVLFHRKSAVILPKEFNKTYDYPNHPDNIIVHKHTLSYQELWNRNKLIESDALVECELGDETKEGEGQVIFSEPLTVHGSILVKHHPNRGIGFYRQMGVVDDHPDTFVKLDVVELTAESASTPTLSHHFSGSLNIPPTRHDEIWLFIHSTSDLTPQGKKKGVHDDFQQTYTKDQAAKARIHTHRLDEKLLDNPLDITIDGNIVTLNVHTVKKSDVEVTGRLDNLTSDYEVGMFLRDDTTAGKHILLDSRVLNKTTSAPFHLLATIPKSQHESISVCFFKHNAEEENKFKHLYTPTNEELTRFTIFANLSDEERHAKKALLVIEKGGAVILMDDFNFVEPLPPPSSTTATTSATEDTSPFARELPPDPIANKKFHDVNHSTTQFDLTLQKHAHDSIGCILIVDDTTPFNPHHIGSYVIDKNNGEYKRVGLMMENAAIVGFFSIPPNGPNGVGWQEDIILAMVTPITGAVEDKPKDNYKADEWNALMKAKLIQTQVIKSNDAKVKAVLGRTAGSILFRVNSMHQADIEAAKLKVQPEKGKTNTN